MVCLNGHTLLLDIFVDRRIPFNVVKQRAFVMGARYGLCEVRAKGNGLFLFMFEDEEGLNEALGNGPWFILKQVIVLKKWLEEMDFKKEEFSPLPIWVKLFNIPTVYWTKLGISALASKVGKPLFADKSTSNSSYLDFARVFIEMNAGSAFPSFFEVVDVKDNTFTILVRV